MNAIHLSGSSSALRTIAAPVASSPLSLSLSIAGARPQQRYAAAGDHALLDRRTSCRERVLDAVLLLLELDLGGRADLDERDAAGQLRQPLLQLLAVPVGVGVVDLALDLGDATLHVVLGTRALDDGGVVLGDLHLAGPAEQVEGGVLELEADLLGDDLAAGEDRDVLAASPCGARRSRAPSPPRPGTCRGSC